MIRQRSPTQYAVEIEKEVFYAAAQTLKHAVIDAMDQYYAAHPPQVGEKTVFCVRITNVVKQKMYTFDVRAHIKPTYGIKKEQ